jgi:hypothetical protein
MSDELDELTEKAKANLVKDGELEPCLLINGKTEQAICDIGLMYTGRADVRRTMFKLGLTIGFGLDAQSIAAVTDSYIRKNLPGETEEDIFEARRKYPSIKDDPNHLEAIMVVILYKDGTIEARTTPYVRKEEGIEFLPDDDFPPEGQWMAPTFEPFWSGVKLGDAKLQQYIDEVPPDVDDKPDNWKEVLTDDIRKISIEAAEGRVVVSISIPPQESDDGK